MEAQRFADAHRSTVESLIASGRISGAERDALLSTAKQYADWAFNEGKAEARFEPCPFCGVACVKSRSDLEAIGGGA